MLPGAISSGDGNIMVSSCFSTATERFADSSQFGRS